ncbi:MAG: SusC/RagA family TonB-linked outer membrane protein [Sphingobacteriales bacterium]|nr:SusC/RagA family TonB-linked outer membrane protein [Sphingobacteriales bacterium]
MKLITVLLVAACLQVSASGYSQKVTLKGENLTLQKVFDEIRKQTGFHFFYADEVLSTAKNVTVNIKKADIDEALDFCFQGQDLSYTISENTIIVRRKLVAPEPLVTEPPAPVPAEIKGKVTDARGEAVAGVSVINERTKRGTTTDANGNYSVQAEPGDVLTFSFVGKASQSVKVTAASTSFNISLADAVMTNENVIVTALGIKREEKALGYAVQKVSGESVQKVSGLDIATSLTGKVAGVLVKNSSDFAAVPVVSVRGESALLVIDGVAYQNKTLSDISSEDIESISILKGATASALYGFRGERGAIMITTKNGSTNNTGVTVNFTSNTMFTAGFLAIPEKQSVYGRGGSGIYSLNSDASWGAKMDGSMQNQWDPISKTFSVRPYLPVGKDNFKNFLEQGYVTNNNLNIGYRKDNVSLRNSFNWVENKGRYPNARLQKYTYAFGADLDLDKFKLTANLSYAKKASKNIGSNGYTSYDPMYSILIWSPSDWDLRQYKNNYWIKPGEIQNNHFGLIPGGTINDYAGNSENNPYFDRYEKTNEISRDIFNADLSMSYQLKPWLKATLRSGVDFYKESGQLRSSWGSYLSSGNTGVPGADYSGWNGGRKGQYNIGVSNGFSNNTDLLLTGERKIKKFTVEYLAGGTIFYRRDDNMNASTQGGLSVPGFFSIKASINPAQVAQSTASQQVNSLFGRVAVSWNRMAYLDFTGRNDWSSTLAKSQRSYFYPSVAASFIASELLPQTRNWLDLLKLRASWTISKRPADIYQINSSYTYSAGTWGTLNGAGVPSNLYDPAINPASSETYEQGLQAIFLKNRVMIDISHYSKRSFDRITTVGLTGASGYSGLVTNFGEEITRRGWEMILTGSPVKTKDWQLDLGFNWSTFASYYTKLDPVYSAKKPWVKVGERADHFISRDFQRVPAGKGDFSGSLILNGSGRPIVHGYDVLFGYYDPKFIWGTNTSLRYKNLSLFLSFDGVNGGLANTRTESYMWQAGVHPNSLSPERELDVATPGSSNYLGQGVKVVSGTATYDVNGNILTDTRVFATNDVKTTYKQFMVDLHNSSAWGGNGSKADTYSRTFFKLREISLSYNVPARLLHKVAKAASVSLIGQNVLLKAKQFKYSDPDGGNEDFADPSTRYIGFKINFTF